jgi:hypothetical protein
MSREPASDPALQPIDALLGEGTPAQLQAFRERLAGDPLLAVAAAETRQIVERLRELRVEPGARWELQRAAVQRRAERFLEVRTASRPLSLQLLAAAAAAAALFAALGFVDPLGLRRAHAPTPLADLTPAAGSRASAVAEARPSEFTAAGEPVVEWLAPAPRLRDAFQRFHERSPEEQFSDWLLPRNAMAVLRLDYELRASSEARRRALRERGFLPDVDERVRRLATEVAAGLLASPDLPIDDLALGVRALLASGRYAQHGAALQAGAGRLARALPELHGGELASALAALGELAAGTGSHLAAVHEHGHRLLREIVEIDHEIWSRRRPLLLHPATPVGQVAAAGRFLALGPAFGLREDEVLLARLLLAAHLQERRDVRNETPDVLTALVYGFGDVLSAAERAEVEERLRIWRPISLVPDYVALQQLAWSRTPRLPGYARFQLDLRRISALPTPPALGDQAALCMCLATHFAAPGALGADRSTE